MKENTLTHFDLQGKAKMVDISHKKSTLRTAKAEGIIFMQKETLSLIKSHQVIKGDVLTVAKVSGILASKNTSSLIPMSHPIKITNVDLTFEIDESESAIRAISKVVAFDKTGAEMEALTAVAVSLLTIYDMCKAADKKMVISNIYLKEKTGGKSGNSFT
ncbi:cyclic pyranopterin monophosphate synthase MoaC [bacterium]|nr:cyclic pyranopterin monophosphate synthase MoaC [bacterium]MBU1153116.1 cyclic pyranopterin monophosphate synthase MoaC [bacterium]MBU1782649.1 cyclic pyranopterin monophosphate synthase MoaC [bacterium]MBU2599221.1 cyclic pyranopterin monophosphate synthase MoaC [bacterium]